jgi:hypothetical protein
MIHLVVCCFVKAQSDRCSIDWQSIQTTTTTTFIHLFLAFFLKVTIDRKRGKEKSRSCKSVASQIVFTFCRFCSNFTFYLQHAINHQISTFFGGLFVLDLTFATECEQKRRVDRELALWNACLSGSIRSKHFSLPFESLCHWFATEFATTQFAALFSVDELPVTFGRCTSFAFTNLSPSLFRTTFYTCYLALGDLYLATSQHFRSNPLCPAEPFVRRPSFDLLCNNHASNNLFKPRSSQVHCRVPTTKHPNTLSRFSPHLALPPLSLSLSLTAKAR